MDRHEVNSYEGLLFLALTHTLHSYCGIMLVVRNSTSWVAVSRGSPRTHVSHSFT